MNGYTTTAKKSTEAKDTDDTVTVDERTERALTQYLTVTTTDAGDEYTVEVHSQSGETYLVDAVEGNCSCPDATHNLDETETCKHVRRARFALGIDAVPVGAVETLEVDDTLGCGTDTDLRFAASDGGIVEADDDAEVLTEDTGTDDEDAGVRDPYAHRDEEVDTTPLGPADGDVVEEDTDPGEFDSCVPKGHATAPTRDAERDVNILGGGL